MSDRNRISIRLHDTERDNVIKGWLDSVRKDPSVNVSEIVKDYLYSVATGGEGDDTKRIIRAIREEFAKLPTMFVQSGTAAATDTTQDDAEEIARRIGNMAD